MRALLDTDILLDVALARQPHASASAAFLARLLELVEVAPVTTAEARRALDLPVSDLEDAFQVSAALAWRADLIVTRNAADYRRSPVRAVAPAVFLRQVAR